MFPEPRAIVPDSSVRPGLNTDSDTIPAYRAVTKDTADDSCVLMTDAAQQPFGITMGAIEVGVTGDIQIAGKAKWETGAAYAKDAQLGSDSTGRAIAVTDPGDFVIGKAETASGGAGEIREVELS
jgi:hypothetical protein